MPMYRRPSSTQTTPTVPAPKNGSSTTPPAGHPARMPRANQVRREGRKVGIRKATGGDGPDIAPGARWSKVLGVIAIWPMCPLGMCRGALCAFGVGAPKTVTTASLRGVSVAVSFFPYRVAKTTVAGICPSASKCFGVSLERWCSRFAYNFMVIVVPLGFTQ